MRTPTLSDIVKRRFVRGVTEHQQPVRALVDTIGIPPLHLCYMIAGQNLPHLPLKTYYRIARWLEMPLANVLILGQRRPKLEELIRLGMEVRGMRVSSTQDQLTAARQAGISVAVFRRALHGYADFTPSPQTCNRLADWLAWTGLETGSIATSAGMLVRYTSHGERHIYSPQTYKAIGPYPCACGRPGCMVQNSVPNGPRRKWRSDACRMWAKRQAQHRGKSQAQSPSSLPHPAPIVRFITINERFVPVRF
ncbi:MAG: hypothetical protein JXA10_17310 [Anaerolineae bacterium]|nr:hypothetical protein [Anaerolineae bacterium]